MKKQCEICGTYRHESTMIFSNSHNLWFCCNECLDQYRRANCRDCVGISPTHARSSFSTC